MDFQSIYRKYKPGLCRRLGQRWNVQAISVKFNISNQI
jgi:hypothetical protein